MDDISSLINPFGKYLKSYLKNITSDTKNKASSQDLANVNGAVSDDLEEKCPMVISGWVTLDTGAVGTRQYIYYTAT